MDSLKQHLLNIDNLRRSEGKRKLTAGQIGMVRQQVEARAKYGRAGANRDGTPVDLRL